MSREAWLAERRSGIGSSDAAVIWGASPWMSPLQLWADKRGLLEAQPETFAMRMGTEMQPIIASEFKRETGREVVLADQDVVVRLDAAPHLICTPDAWWYTNDKTGLLELKTTGKHNADKWDESVPLHYQIQVQHQMLVTNSTYASIAVIIGGQEFRWMDIERNADFLEQHMEKCLAFWQRVQSGDAPSADHRDSGVLNDLFKVETGDVIELPASFADLDAERERVWVALEEAKEELAAINNQFKQAIGNNIAGLIPGVAKYSFKTVNRKGYTVEPTSYRELRRVKP